MNDASSFPKGTRFECVASVPPDVGAVVYEQHRRDSGAPVGVRYVELTDRNSL